jgi:prepilin-type processing-associated H-X9-DG protein
LISILLPVISGARRQARLVQCSSNLRNLVQACQMHAHEHAGYLPLAGRLVADPLYAGSFLPAGLNDGLRTRYNYAAYPNAVLKAALVPLPAGLAPYLGVTNLPDKDVNALDQALNSPDGVWRFFICPDTSGTDKAKYNSDPNDNNFAGQGTMMTIASGPVESSAWSTNSDYGLNEGVFGFNYDLQYGHNRRAGHLSRLGRSSEVILFGDAIPRKAPALSYMPIGWICWTPSLNGSGPATLGDAFAGNGRAEAPDNFDLNRHSGRMNVGFADGHVSTVVLKKVELDSIYLIPPQ